MDAIILRSIQEIWILCLDGAKHEMQNECCRVSKFIADRSRSVLKQSLSG